VKSPGPELHTRAPRRVGGRVALGAGERLAGGDGRYGDVDNHGARRAVTTKGDRCNSCAAVAALGRRSLDLALAFTGP